MPSRLKKLFRISLKILGAAALFFAFAGGGTMTYFHFAPPSKTCLTCHEMQGSHDRWASSAHKDIHCRNCHGGSLTLDFHALKEHANRVVGHFSMSDHSAMRLTHEQVLRVSQSCGTCHQSEYTKWRSGGHAATFARIFLDEKQNKREGLAGDCMRCHGMYFEGPTEELVTPMNTAGPWKLLKPELANQPTVPCLACHQVHTPKVTGQTGATLFVRREKAHFKAANLPIVRMVGDEGKLMKVSPDPRQRQCVQCHAPNAFHKALSGDDRTAGGKHEGLSCVACHDPHSGDAKASCAQCHTSVKEGYKVHE